MSTTGHENEVIDVQGLKASLQKLKTDHVDGKAAKATTLQGYGITDAYTKTEVNGLVSTPHEEYVTVATFASLPATGSTDTIYRVSSYDGANNQVDDTVYSQYAWDGTQYVFLCVKSQIDEVFDITVYNSNTKYADLAAALGVDGANIPQSLRRGGMSVKFVQSSDNLYRQFKLLNQTFSTNIVDWQGVDAQPNPGSRNLIESNAVAGKLLGISGKLDIVNIDVANDVHDGYVSSNGSIQQYTSPTTGITARYVAISVTNADKVRFMGQARTDSTPSRCAFYDINDNLVGSVITLDIQQQTNYFKEYVVDIPEGAVIFKTPYDSSVMAGLPNIFYCCLQTGYPAASTFKTGEFIGDYGIDKEPTAGSHNLVESGGVADELDNINIILSKEDVHITLNAQSVTSGYYYSASGERKPNANLFYIFIPLQKSSSISISGGSMIVNFCNASKQFISNIANYISSVNANVPDNAEYICLSGYISSLNNYIVTLSYPQGLQEKVGTLSIDVKNNTENLDYRTYYKANPSIDKVGYYNNSGTYNSNNTYRTFFVPVDKITTYLLIEGPCIYINFVGTEKQFISAYLSGWSSNTVYKITKEDIPVNAEYISLSYYYTSVITVYTDRRATDRINRQNAEDFSWYFRKGSFGNINNNKAAHTSRIIDISNCAYLTVDYNADDYTDGDVVIWNYLFFNISDGDTQDNRLANVGSGQSVGKTIEIDNRQKYKGIAIQVEIERNGSKIELLWYNIDKAIIFTKIALPTYLINTAYTRNIERSQYLAAATNFRKASDISKRFMLLELTDSHLDNVACNDGRIMAEGFVYIDTLIHCGDFCGSNATNFSTSEYLKLVKCTKPFLFVVGNHDVGNSKVIADCITTQQAFTRYISPLITNNILASGEYIDGKPYYYHDFTDYSIRLICVYEYDDPQDVNPNDSTKYIIRRGDSVISQTQAEWFCNVLKNTPSNYRVLVAMHNPFSPLADSIECKFTQQGTWTGGYGSQRLFDTDLWADIINAWKNKSQYHCDMHCTGDAAYLNDQQTGYYYSFDFDFASSLTDKFLGYIGGHVHKDIVWQHRNYNYQKQITPVCSCAVPYSNNNSSDIALSNNNDAIERESLTAISYSNDNIKLVKLGANVTTGMTLRDCETIAIL